MLSRRNFLNTVGTVAAGMILTGPLHAAIAASGKKLKLVLIGTGVRGNSFWGKRILDKYGDIAEFVALVDHNPGRLEYASDYIGVDKHCKLYTNFEDMIKKESPDLIMVTTTDATHHTYIVKSLEAGIDVLTEKPMTTDEFKCQEILDAERKHKRKVIVAFNYRWSPYNTKIKEMLDRGDIGDVVSVDFSWMLNTSHGASYFRRWHGERDQSGTLLVHKSTHHFDLINWWLNSEPSEVFAYGDLEYYGRNPKKKGVNCRNCNEKDTCKFYWDITKSEDYKRYTKHEKHDGYVRDNCLFRPEINIYDKMNVNIKYANNVYVNYMLTTYSPWEGWRVAFNGTKGRLEAFLDVPYIDSEKLSQKELHAAEMNQKGGAKTAQKPIILHQLWGKQETVSVPYSRGGHGGGDVKLHDQIFLHPEKDDEFKHMAGTRDGAMSILIGVAARNSIESGEPVKIGTLTDLQPRKKRI